MSSTPPPPYESAPPAGSYGAQTPAKVPGRTLGIIAFVLSFFLQLVALIMGIIALVQSKRAGAKNGWAVAAIIVSTVLIVLGIILFFAILVPLITFGQQTLEACAAAGYSGTVTVNGIEVNCTDAR